MAWTRWAGVLAGALMGVATVVTLVVGAAQPVPYGAGFAALVLLLLTWPRPVDSPWPDAQLRFAADRRLADELGLTGPVVVDPRGLLFFGAPGAQGWPPLDDGRSLYDGGDGHPAGIVLRHPCAGILDAERTRDPSRYADMSGLEESLAAMRDGRVAYRSFRVVEDAPAVRYRFRTVPDAPEGTADAVHAFVALAAASSSGRPVRLEESRTVEGDEEGLLSFQGGP